MELSNQLDGIMFIVQNERRRRNKQLLEAVENPDSIYNIEDLFRLVGDLEATYQHLGSMKVISDTNVYCCLKHLASAYVHALEVDGDVKLIMEIIGLLTNNRIRPCSACKDDMEEIE